MSSLPKEMLMLSSQKNGTKIANHNHQEEVVEEEAGQLMAPVGNAKRTGPAESILQECVMWFGFSMFFQSSVLKQTEPLRCWFLNVDPYSLCTSHVYFWEALPGEGRTDRGGEEVWGLSALSDEHQLLKDDS